MLDDLADQLVLLKMHGLNFSHVNICVIGTGTALEHSQSQSKAAVRVTDRALDLSIKLGNSWADTSGVKILDFLSVSE